MARIIRNIKRYFNCHDSNKIQNDLGWSPKYSFDVGIEQTIQWYLDNQNWTNQIKSGEYKEYYEKMYSCR